MNKKEFVELLSEELEYSRAEAGKVLDATFKMVKEALKKHADLRFAGFGTFKVKSRAAREVRSPRDGKMIKVPKTNYVSFAAGIELKKAANQNKLK